MPLSVLDFLNAPFRVLQDMHDGVQPYLLTYLIQVPNSFVHLIYIGLNFCSFLMVHYIGIFNLGWYWFLNLYILFYIFKCVMIHRLQMEINDNYPRLAQNMLKMIPDKIRIREDNLGSKTSIQWLNGIIRTLWLNYSALARYYILRVLWPRIQINGAGTVTDNIMIYDFQMGDQTPVINSIKAFQHENDLIVDMDFIYDGNATVTCTFDCEGMKLSVPITIKEIKINELKIRIILKKLRPFLKDGSGFMSGLQFFFLEIPKFGWKTGAAARIIDIPGLESLIIDTIAEPIIARFTIPNRISIPLIKDKDDRLAMTESVTGAAMHRPVGVVRVNVIKAEGLRGVLLSFEKFQASRNLNPLNYKYFGRDLLPRMSTCKPYAILNIGRDTYKSDPGQRTTGPHFNCKCDFPVEYYHDQRVIIQFYNDNASFIGVISSFVPSDDKDRLFLGQITEAIEKIKEKRKITAWYNLEVYRGRALLEFEWIPLSDKSMKESGEGKVIPGALSLLMGTLESNEIFRFFIKIEIVKDDTTILHEAKTLSAKTGSNPTAMNEGKVFRIYDLNDETVKLRMIIRNKTKSIGELIMGMKEMASYPLNGHTLHFIPLHENETKKISITLYSNFLYDN